MLIPLASFIGEGDPPSSSSSKCSLLLEENSSHWINVSATPLVYAYYTINSFIQQVTDVLHFLTTNDDNIQFLWLSERSGYRHLEMVTVVTGSNKDVSDIMQHCMVQRKVLTNGEWMIKQDQVSIVTSRACVIIATLKRYIYEHVGRIAIDDHSAFSHDPVLFGGASTNILLIMRGNIGM